MTDAEWDALIADAEYEHERGRTAGGDVTAAALCGRLAAALRELRGEAATWLEHKVTAEHERDEAEAALAAAQERNAALLDAVVWLRDNWSRRNPFTRKSKAWIEWNDSESEQFDMVDAAIDAAKGKP